MDIIEPVTVQPPSLDPEKYPVNAAGVRPSACLIGDGISEAHVGKLRSYGYCTVERIATVTEKELRTVKVFPRQLRRKLPQRLAISVHWNTS